MHSNITLKYQASELRNPIVIFCNYRVIGPVISIGLVIGIGPGLRPYILPS